MLIRSKEAVQSTLGPKRYLIRFAPRFVALPVPDSTILPPVSTMLWPALYAVLTTLADKPAKPPNKAL
jgi:hypothetical protein